MEVEKRTGVSTARIERLAREFAANGPAIAIIGGSPLGHTNGMFNALAVNALNALAGSVGALYALPTYTALLELRDLLSARGAVRGHWR